MQLLYMYVYVYKYVHVHEYMYVWAYTLNCFSLAKGKNQKLNAFGPWESTNIYNNVAFLLVSSFLLWTLHASYNTDRQYTIHTTLC